METLNSNSSPNKRLKSETLTLIPPISPSIKGKAPIDSSDDDIPPQLPPQNCGICFSEPGKTVRGLIDSCDHYFCFLCIIEWSKIDSRCPLCRGRFSSIRRVRKDGSFIGSGSVTIPVRDQIYDPYGEYVDPYGQAKCSVCSGTKDECLLLLCDLCDSASHSYCVGLGATVPEGDWYCHDCDLLRAEQIDSGMDNNEETSTVPKKEVKQEDLHDDEPESSDPVSIFDIVREPGEPRRGNLGTDRLLKLASLNPTKFSSSSIVSPHPNSSSARNLPGASFNLVSQFKDRESSARTLGKSRDVHRHISVLRENWDALRTGSLNFSSKLCPDGNVSQKINGASISVKGSGQLQSTKSLQSKAQETSCKATQKEPSYNVPRAWKMMNASKLLKQANTAKTASTSALKTTHGLKVGKVVSKCMSSAKKENQKPAKKINESHAQSSGEHRSCSASTAASASRNKYKDTCVQANTYNNNKPSLASCGKLRTGPSSAFFDGSACSTSSAGPLAGPSHVSCINSQKVKISTSPVKHVEKLNISVGKDVAQTSVQTGFCNDKGGLTSRPNLGSCVSKSSSDHRSSVHPFSQENLSGVSDKSSIKLKEKEVSKTAKNCGTKISSKASKSVEVKDEVASLVKLNLKLLCKEKRLESEAFKEIARVSTHTILASCGFKHRDIVRSIPMLVCRHDNQTQELPRSALVPTSCRDCFYTFVKDVVNSILSEKMKNDTKHL